MKLGGKIALFAAGAIAGSEGVKLLASKDAHKVFAGATAAVLRCRNQIMHDVEAVQEECSDILEDAKNINAKREKASQPKVIEDTACQS